MFVVFGAKIHELLGGSWAVNSGCFSILLCSSQVKEIAWLFFQHFNTLLLSRLATFVSNSRSRHPKQQLYNPAMYFDWTPSQATNIIRLPIKEIKQNNQYIWTKNGSSPEPPANIQGTKNGRLFAVRNRRCWVGHSLPNAWWPWREKSWHLKRSRTRDGWAKFEGLESRNGCFQK